MALLLILLGIVIAVLVNSTIGILLVLAGIVLLFVPAIPYGPRSRRGGW